MFHLLVYLLILPIVWLFGWVMAVNWTRYPMLTQVENLRVEVQEMKKMIESLSEQAK